MQTPKPFGFAAFAVVLMLSLCARAPAADTLPATGPSTRPVTVPATVEPYEQTDLYPRTGGYVAEVKADIGDHVKYGDVLAVIDQPEIETELAEAKATLIAKQKLVEAADAALQQTQKALEVARSQVVRYRAEVTLQDATFKRQKELAAGKAITDQQLDESRSKAEVASADADIAEAKVGAAEADIKGADAAKAVAAAQADVAAAQVDKIEALKKYLRITAPYDGIITRRHVNRGDLAQPAGSGRSASLFTIQQVDKVRIRCDVSETAAEGIQIGSSATIKFYGGSNQPIEAKVSRTAHSLDPQTRTLRVEIDLENPQGRIRPGTYAQVTLVPIAGAAAQ